MLWIKLLNFAVIAKYDLTVDLEVVPIAGWKFCEIAEILRKINQKMQVLWWIPSFSQSGR